MGNNLCQQLWYDYDTAKGFDNVAITMQLDIKRFSDRILTIDAPSPLKTPTQPGGIEGQKLRDKLDSRFMETWTYHKKDLDNAVILRTLDDAHDIWCLASETFLWRYCSADWSADLPQNQPTRGRKLPMVERDIAIN